MTARIETMARVFEPIPDGWELKEVGQVAEINPESVDPTRNFRERQFSYIDIESVQGGGAGITNAQSLAGRDAPLRARRLVRVQDVIMSTVRPYLKAFAIVPIEYDNQICSTGFAVLRSKGGIISRYLLYALLSDRVIEQCSRRMVGAQYPALTGTQVQKIRILLPPLPEQRKIAEILTAVDRTINKIEEIIEKTERFRKGLMQRLLTRGIGHKEFKETEIGKMPREWQLKELEEVAHINRESRDPARECPDGRFFYVDIDSVENGTGVFRNVREVVGKDAPSRARRVVRHNDVIMSTVRPYLKAFAIVPQTYDNQISSTGFAVLTCKQNILPIYLLYALFSDPFVQQCNKAMVGGQYPALNSSQVARIMVPIPSPLEQQKIAEILNTVDRRLELLRQKKQRLERTKAGLMNDLLTGRKRVKLAP